MTLCYVIVEVTDTADMNGLEMEEKKPESTGVRQTFLVPHDSLFSLYIVQYAHEYTYLYTKKHVHVNIT